MAAAPLQQVHPIVDLLSKKYKQKDYAACTKILPKLKAVIAQLRSLPPMYEATPTAPEELELARDVYELSVVISLNTEDEEAFENDFLHLKQYYYAAVGLLPPSPQEDLILGLNLLRLLVQNRDDEFHSELELLAGLSPSALEKPCVKHAVELERLLMEEGGGYVSVLLARQGMADDVSAYTYANYFMDLVEKALRDKEANIAEGDMKINDAGILDKAKESAPCKEIPSLKLINQMIAYVTKLDQIDGNSGKIS